MLIRIASASEGPNEISRSHPPLEITHQIRFFCFLLLGIEPKGMCMLSRPTER